MKETLYNIYFSVYKKEDATMTCGLSFQLPAAHPNQAKDRAARKLSEQYPGQAIIIDGIKDTGIVASSKSEQKISVMFFLNGTTVAYDSKDNPIGELQIGWLSLYLNFLISEQIDPFNIIFTMPDGKEIDIEAYPKPHLDYFLNRKLITAELNAWNEGYSGAIGGQTMNDNPYRADTVLSWTWKLGWYQRKYEDFQVKEY